MMVKKLDLAFYQKKKKKKKEVGLGLGIGPLWWQHVITIHNGLLHVFDQFCLRSLRRV